MKRLIPLLLALLLVLSACTGKARPEETYIPKYTPTPEPEPTESVEPGVQIDGTLLTALGDTITVDLDSDGKQDEVSLSRDADGLRLTINGQDYTGVLYSVWDFEYADSDYFAVVNLDRYDRALEVAVEDYGPSDDPQTFFFRYEKETVTCIGSVPSLCWDDWTKQDTVTYMGNGSLLVNARLDGLMTWFGDVTYRIDRDGKLAMVRGEMCAADQLVNVTLTNPVLAYESTDSEPEKLYPGDTLQLSGTDQSQWVQAYRSGGAPVLLRLNPDDRYQVETPTGFEDGPEVMNGLIFAG